MNHLFAPHFSFWSNIYSDGIKPVSRRYNFHYIWSRRYIMNHKTPICPGKIKNIFSHFWSTAYYFLVLNHFIFLMFKITVNSQINSPKNDIQSNQQKTKKEKPKLTRVAPHFNFHNYTEQVLKIPQTLHNSREPWHRTYSCFFCGIEITGDRSTVLILKPCLHSKETPIYLLLQYDWFQFCQPPSTIS